MIPIRKTIPHGAALLALVLALILVVLIAILSYRSWSAFGSRSNQLAISQEVSEETNALISSLKDAETGQRGYLLTGRDEYLQPYRRALVDVPAHLDRLITATQAHVDQTQRIKALRPLITEKLTELKQTIDLRRTNQPAAALAVVLSDRGNTLMNQIRQICAEIEQVSYRRVAELSEQARSSANQIGLVSTVGSTVLFILLLVSALTIQRVSNRREHLIQELKVSDEKARTARDLLQTTIASIGDGVIATDAVGNVTFLNPVAESLTGWSQETAWGKPLQEMFVINNEHTNAQVENPVSKALREGRVVGLANHTILTSKDGRRIPIDDSAAPIRDTRGEIQGVILVFRDVTERKLAETAQAERTEIAGLGADVGAALTKMSDLPPALQHCAQAVVDHLDAAFARIWTVSETEDVLELQASAGMYTHLNGSHARVPVGALKIGLIAQERRAHLTNDVATDSRVGDREWAKREGMVAFAGYPLVVEDRLVGVIAMFARHPLSKHALSALASVADSIAVGIVRKRSEESLARQAEELTRSNADLQQFAFAASHDLQEPLRMITSYSQLLVKGFRGQLEDEAALCVNFITEGTRRMRALLEDLLAYTQLNAGNGDGSGNFVNLNHILQKTVENLKTSLEESQAVVSSDRLPYVRGQEAHFLQLFQNLIGNAIKYRGEQPPKIHLSTVRTDGVWRLAVMDNGIGIDPQYHQTIFGVFKRLHGKAIPGTGIGLAICQRVVERYGGRIWVESELNKGATFYCTLPTARENGNG
ncbi:MAG: CHASE3 domain-containing protein [Bryobacterales bacterium]|nr:CHASE3 domain-containing protein [Bryobacterales bacterium]